MKDLEAAEAANREPAKNLTELYRRIIDHQGRVVSIEGHDEISGPNLSMGILETVRSYQRYSPEGDGDYFYDLMLHFKSGVEGITGRASLSSRVSVLLDDQWKVLHEPHASRALSI